MRRLVVALTLLLAAPAQAAPLAPVAAIKTKPISLQIAGGRVFWDDGRNLKTTGATLFTLPKPEPAQTVKFDDLSASAAGLAFSADGTTQPGDVILPPDWTSLRSGPLAGPFALIDGDERSKQSKVDAFAMTDAGLATHRMDSKEIRLAGAKIATVSRPVVDLAGNGPYLAVMQNTGELDAPGGGRIDVYDTRSATRLYGVTLDGGGANMVLGPDATLGTYLYVDDAMQWATPAAPTLHKIKTPLLDLSAITASTAIITVETGDFSRVRALDLATGATRDLSPALAVDEVVAASDGGQLAYATPNCVYVGDLPSAPPAQMPTSPTCGPLAVDAALNHGGARSAKLRLECPGGVQDRCSGVARIVGRKNVLITKVAYALQGGQTLRKTLRFTRAQINRGSAGDTVPPSGRPYHVLRLVVTSDQTPAFYDQDRVYY